MRKIVILGIAKNIENCIGILADCLQTILELWESSKNRAYLYENDSTDSTPEKLRALAAKDPRIHVRTEKGIMIDSKVRSFDNKPCRMECIATARNACMELWESSDSEDSIVIWMDLDRVTRLDPVPIEFFAKQLSEAPPKTITAVFPYSINHKGDMYDTYAYRDETFLLGPEFLGAAWWESTHQTALQNHIRATQGNHRSVFSACNGFGMYRSEAIRGLRFTAYPTAEMEKILRLAWRTESHPAYKALRDSQTNLQTHVNGASMGLYPFGKEGLWYRNNSGYNYPVVCEWVPFHFALRERGYTGLFLITGWRDVSGH